MSVPDPGTLSSMCQEHAWADQGSSFDFHWDDYWWTFNPDRQSFSLRSPHFSLPFSLSHFESCERDTRPSHVLQDLDDVWKFSDAFNVRCIPSRYTDQSMSTDAPPEISINGASPTTTYLLVALDIDAPFPAFTPLGPILHWIQPGFKVTGTTLGSSEPFVANYIGPAPPPFGGAHRYIFFLYEQPAAFDAKKYAPPGGKNLGNGSRMRYDLDAFDH